MPAVDTNVVVRLLTRDDESQFQKSRALFATGDIFIPDTVVLESAWVLRFAYGLEAAAICEALERLFGLESVRLQNPAAVAQAIAWCEEGLDFADALHLALSQGQGSLRTFDRDFARKARGKGDCVVESP